MDAHASSSSDGAPLAVSARSTLRRKRERGSHERTVVAAILDEGIVAHVGFVADGGPVVLPMAYARVDGALYLHGAAGNHMLRTLGEGVELCVTVTLLDGLVLARSAFHHSMNYRSVVLFGTGVIVTAAAEKALALDALVEHMVPGRSADARPGSAAELRATTVIRLPIVEGSAKVRTGGPADDDEDMDLPVWAGQIPLALTAGAPVPEQQLPPAVAVPGYVTHYARAPA